MCDEARADLLRVTRDPSRYFSPGTSTYPCPIRQARFSSRRHSPLTELNYGAPCPDAPPTAPFVIAPSSLLSFRLVHHGVVTRSATSPLRNCCHVWIGSKALLGTSNDPWSLRLKRRASSTPVVDVKVSRSR